MKLSYCDYIADKIKKNLNAATDLFDKEKQLSAGPVKMDLHPREGYLMSTKKTVEVADWNGKKYKVTVEEL